MATPTQKPEETAEQRTPEEQERQAEASAALAKRPAAPVKFDADDPVSLYMDGGVFNQLQRVAKLMTTSGLVPSHLRSNKAEDRTSDCFLVAAQAFRWRMDPFALAQHTYVLEGRLGYEGKLVAAVVNTHPRVVGRLKPQYSGSGAKRRVLISGRIKGESEDRTVEGAFEDWHTLDKSGGVKEPWKKSPDQMLFYRGAREWARRHMPEALIGIRAEEELAPVEMERAASGGFQPRSIGELTEKLQADVAAGQASDPASAEPDREPGSDDGDEAPPPAAKAKPADCEHPGVPPSRIAQTPRGKAVVCEDCGTEIPGEAEPAKTGAKKAGQRRLEED